MRRYSRSAWKISVTGSVTSRIVFPCSCARLMILSSTSVRFMTCTHVPAAQPQRAPQQVVEQERAEVAEVRRVVDRGSAGVHAHGVAVGGRERLDRARQRVVQTELGHTSVAHPRAEAGDECYPTPVVPLNRRLAADRRHQDRHARPAPRHERGTMTRSSARRRIPIATSTTRVAKSRAASATASRRSRRRRSRDDRRSTAQFASDA